MQSKCRCALWQSSAGQEKGDSWPISAVVPELLNRIVAVEPVVATALSAMQALLSHSVPDVAALQEADPVIGEVLRFWQQSQHPAATE